MDSRANKTSSLLIAAAWIVVMIPLGWGVYQSLVKSLPLFRQSSAPTPPRPVPPFRGT
jgi:hypothetical protein